MTQPIPTISLPTGETTLMGPVAVIRQGAQTDPEAATPPAAASPATPRPADPARARAEVVVKGAWGSAPGQFGRRREAESSPEACTFAL